MSNPTSEQRIWQPAETAPKDGTEVILCIPDGGDLSAGRHMAIAAWSSEYGQWLRVEHDQLTATWPPTHWMSLPELPK